jgi:hypothetical protein
MSDDSAYTDWVETYKSLVTLATEGFKFCALANGGAAIALLAYLGNVAGKGLNVPDVRWAMAAFLVGLTFCGVAMIFAYLTQLKRLNELAGWKQIGRDWRLSIAILGMAESVASFAVGSCIAVATFK